MILQRSISIVHKYYRKPSYRTFISEFKRRNKWEVATVSSDKSTILILCKLSDNRFLSNAINDFMKG